jgi:glycosyltransferase involved in cell wall biosynthesis
MRVLWFSGTPSLASEKLNDQGNIGGWIASLEKEVAKISEIQLGVAFPFGYDKENNFEIEGTRYYSFPYSKDTQNFKGLINRWKHAIEPDNITEYYLKIIEDFKPDIIQIFGTEAPFGTLVPLVDIPTVIHIQGNLTIYSYKWFTGISSIDVLRYSSIKTIIKAYGLWHLKFLFSKRAKRERKLMQYGKYYLGRTDWDRRISSVLSPGRIYYHCEELLRNEFYEAKHWQKPISEKIKIISTLSSMIYKGLETVLETMQLLKDNTSNEFEWVIVGMKGTEEIVDIIENATKLSFSDFNVIFKGSLKPGELISELHQSHLYVHPSHIENSPNSVCEAMLIGMPVIATYSGGTPSIVANGIDGLLVQDGDPWALAGAIVELSQDVPLMLSLAQNATKRAVVRHNREAIGHRMAEIYNEVLEHSRKSVKLVSDTIGVQ